MAVTRMYVPAGGQADKAARAAALGAGLSVPETADAPRYADAKDQLPAVILENGNQIVILPEPTTLAAVDTATDELEASVPVEETPPAMPPLSLAINEEGEQIEIAVTMPDGSTRTGIVPLL